MPKTERDRTVPTVTDPLVAGEKIRVIFDAGKKLDRECVARFLAHEDQHLGSMSRLVMDFRPEAGTSEVYRRDIRAVYRVAKETPLMLPRIHRGEFRVL